MRGARNGTAIILVSSLLFLAVFLGRWMSDDAATAITVLYAVPVALLASRFGLRAGLGAACVAFGLTLFWSATQGQLGALGLGVRLTAFVIAGLAAGLGADQLRSLAVERQGLQQRNQTAVQQAEQARDLEALSGLLSRVATEHQVAAAYLDAGVPLLGATDGGVYLLDRAGDHLTGGEPVLRLLAGTTFLPADRGGRSLPLSRRSPPTDAVRTAAATFQGSAEKILTSYPDLAPACALSGDQAWAAAPLRGLDGVLGAVTAGFDRPQPFTRDQQQLLDAVAQRVAEALGRARLLAVTDQQRRRAEASEQWASRQYAQQRDVAATLQQALLPGALPEVAGIAAQARYLPGSAALDVGGDWYDVLELPDGRVGIAVGDVLGRGVSAAATMGRLRSALAAIAAHCAGPAQLLERLEAFAASVPGAMLATVAYADFDLRTRRLRYACAGHPPPLLVDADGARFLQGGRGTPLLADAPAPRAQSDLLIRGTATLICYSDGLLERRDADLDSRFADLAGAAAALHDGPLDALCDGLLKKLVADQPPHEDVALVCLRLQDEPAPTFRLTIDAAPAQLAPLRTALRAWARQCGIGDQRLHDLLLSVNEACANAIEHAYRDGDRGHDGTTPGGAPGSTPGEVEVEAAAQADGSVAIRVRDTGRWREPSSVPGLRGRGLAIVHAVMTDVGVRQEPSGSTVTMVLLPPQLS